MTRHFIEIGEFEVDSKDALNCKSISSSRSMHSVRSVSPFNNVLLEVRDFSCFCEHCVKGTVGICPNIQYVQLWKLETLEPVRAGDAVQEVEEVEHDLSFQLDDNLNAVELQVGDNFAVAAESGNAEGVEFYILQYTKAMYLEKEDTLTDAWKGVTEMGDEVVEGLYYKQQGKSPKSYVLLRDHGVARIFSHLVCHSKFAMSQLQHKQKRQTSVYCLSDTTLGHIQEIICRRAQLDEMECLSEGDCDDSSECSSSSSSDSEDGDTDTET